MFKQFFDVFWPRATEYVAEQGLSNALNIKDFEHTLENLQENLKLLSAKAIDVETEIKNAEDSGRKKRKREVEVWLEGVKSIEKEVDELGSEPESGGFVMRFLDGGRAAQLNADIHKLVQQHLNFGEPVLDSRGTREEILLTNGMVGDAFSENLETVLNLLESRQVSKIGVYGMGGVGKTTLAKHIYNNEFNMLQHCFMYCSLYREDYKIHRVHLVKEFTSEGLFDHMRMMELPVSGLPNLEYIHIESCGEIEEIFEEDEGRAASTLPKLTTYLNLDDLPRLRRVSNATIVCNSIRKISIRKCPRLTKKLPLHFDDPTPPPSLREIRVERKWWESLVYFACFSFGWM